MKPALRVVAPGNDFRSAAPIRQHNRLLLRAFPDDFVDGLAGMMTFAVTAMVIALVAWATH